MSYAASILTSYGRGYRSAGDVSDATVIVRMLEVPMILGSYTHTIVERVSLRAADGRVFELGRTTEPSVSPAEYRATVPAGEYTVLVDEHTSTSTPMNPGVTIVSPSETYSAPVTATTGATVTVQRANMSRVIPGAPTQVAPQVVPMFILPADQGRLIVRGLPDSPSQRAVLAGGVPVPLARNGAEWFANVPAGNYTLSTWRDETVTSGGSDGTIGSMVRTSRVDERSFPVAVTAGRNTTYAYSPTGLTRVGDAPANQPTPVTPVVPPPVDGTGIVDRIPASSVTPPPGDPMLRAGLLLLGAGVVLASVAAIGYSAGKATE